ncbi:tetratricopeptide repeat protein [Herbivorax sp. ANBcel31]|uniref:tetratricopeptide repeat protein n=1 Tax=Herbivorax sp. ANBcel31 TaxID=3069754 RepID=UPI0027AEDDB1|nr:tetratricopeptide repeat protein [Herbivorax sp. ANBcel31]MDQ2085601.1 tetratricopeptide repeat protein [Herbivorax sp. ANBcel31]
MFCFNCGIKLHNGEMKECQLCGVKFSKVCSICGFPNPSMGKYCFNCGKKLSIPDLPENIGDINKLSENRKNVAVIFADVSGFTALSEKMDPEEIREIINECFNYITKPVYELEGTIDKYIGDCVMILFGAKYIHRDDSKRAVMCAVNMMDRVKEFSEERLSTKGLSLTLSIGINYGLVVTGGVGNAFDKDYTVMGDIVNTAQRLQSNAKRGTILVSESVFVETKDIVRYSEPEDIKVKNKEKPVRCYSPIEVSINNLDQNKVNFIGREKELKHLISTYNDAVNTGTKCVNVVGEAGIGKTRLLKEFCSKLNSDNKKIWVDLSSLYQNRVYYTISSILMKVLNINSTDNASVKERRLMSFLDYILGDLNEDEIKRNCDFIGLILGLGRDEEFENILNSMTFDSIKRELIKQLSIFFTGLSKKQKLLIIVDDMHWSDTNSIYILKKLIKMLSFSNITFIFSSRTEIKELKCSKEKDIHILKMCKLKRENIKKMACQILDTKDIDKDFLNKTVKLTNGNPLYVSEFICNIIKSDSYIIKNNIGYIKVNEVKSLPSNIQDLILSKFSEFEDDAKNILHIASVLGKEFHLSILKEILECSGEKVEELLIVPLQMNIISLKTAYTISGLVEKVFVFNQDMEREIIYYSILNKNKRDIHKKIGRVIESKHKREIENHYETLFVHFSKAGISKKAAEYSFRTAIKNKNAYDFTNALIYYAKFLNIGIKDDAKFFGAYKDMGYINFIMANYDVALYNFKKSLEYAKLNDDVNSVRIMVAEVLKEQDFYENALKILNELQPKIKEKNNLYGKLLQMKCSILRIIGDQEALSIAKKSEKLMIEMMDYENLSETMNQAGIIYYSKGDVQNSLLYMEKSFKYAEKVNDLAIMAKVSGNLGAIYHATGMISKAQKFFEKSIEISKKISDQQGYIAGLINLGILYLDKGVFDKAEDLFNEAIKISREISSRLNECIALSNIGDIMYEKSDDEKALKYYNKSLEIAKKINVPVGEGINYLALAKLYIKTGQNSKVPQLFESAFKIFNEAGEMPYLSDYYRHMAQYDFNKGNIDKAIKECDQAIKISNEVESDIRKLKALRLKAEIYCFLGRNQDAVELCTQSINIAHQIESDYEAQKCKRIKERCLS